MHLQGSYTKEVFLRIITEISMYAFEFFEPKELLLYLCIKQQTELKSNLAVPNIIDRTLRTIFSGKLLS